MVLEPWESLARAVAARLEWERLCGRSALLDEAQVRCAAAEFLHASRCGDIDTECEHPNLTDRYLDLIGRKKGNILWALEAKWVCTSKGARQWDIEVAEAIVRLQFLTADMSVSPAAVRVLLLAGPKREIDKGLFMKGKHTGAGPKQPIFAQLLPIHPQGGMTKIKVRQSHPDWLRKFWTDVANKTGGRLPSTYDAKVASQALLNSNDPDSVFVQAWKITRPTGWSSFCPSDEWSKSNDAADSR